jgi:TetR/AcrR family transcriptional regulator, regulator of biofilm formation and stress response
VQLFPYHAAVVAVERRQPRGERRRSAILAAALRVIAERGVAATTHRAVAEAAGVPTSTTTYYFKSLDELLDEALLLFVREEAERLRAMANELEGQPVPPAEVARTLVAELRAGQGTADVAQFELYLEASRRPSLREAARASLDLYAAVAETALRAAGSPRPEEGARVFVALIDGLGLHRIASGADQDIERAVLTLFIPFAMDEAELRGWRDRLSPPGPPPPARSAPDTANS